MPVYGYIRVSTLDQSENGESLETQRNKVVGYAMMQGWTVDEVFVEGGVSGSVPLEARQQGKALLARLQPGDAIITPKMDRAFRSADDALATLRRLKEGNVSLHMIDLGGDVTGNGISKLVFTILAAVAESERDRIRERITEVKQDMKRRGLYNGGKRPYGYDVIDGQLVANEAEQKLLAEAKEMRKDGNSLRAIGALLGMDAKSVKRILDRDA